MSPHPISLFISRSIFTIQPPNPNQCRPSVAVVGIELGEDHFPGAETLPGSILFWAVTDWQRDERGLGRSNPPAKTTDRRITETWCLTAALPKANFYGAMAYLTGTSGRLGPEAWP
jgi:hypothetical protein